jgi:hypothetical protein
VRVLLKRRPAHAAKLPVNISKPGIRRRLLRW